MKKTWNALVIKELDVNMTFGGRDYYMSESSIIKHPEKTFTLDTWNMYTNDSGSSTAPAAPSNVRS